MEGRISVAVAHLASARRQNKGTAFWDRMNAGRAEEFSALFFATEAGDLPDLVKWAVTCYFIRERYKK